MTRPWEAERGLCEADPDCIHGSACRTEQCTAGCGRVAHVLGYFRSAWICRSCEEARYGSCQVCHRELRLKKDGTLRHHGSDIWVGGRREYQCKGAGLLPLGGST